MENASGQRCCEVGICDDDRARMEHVVGRRGPSSCGGKGEGARNHPRKVLV